MSEPACADLTPVTEEHRNPWFARDRAGYYTVEYHQQQVIVLPVVDDSMFLMVRCKRRCWQTAPLNPYRPVDPEETPEEGSSRELAEETGVSVEASRFVLWRQLHSPPTAPRGLSIFSGWR